MARYSTVHSMKHLESDVANVVLYIKTKVYMMYMMYMVYMVYMVYTLPETEVRESLQ